MQEKSKADSLMLKLFWPKELLEAMEKFEKEGTLNEVAVNNIKKITYKHLVGMTIISVLLALEYKIGLVLLALSPFLIKFDLHRIFYNSFYPYISGEKVKAIFVKVRAHGLGGGWLPIYYIPSNKINIACEVGYRLEFKSQNWPKKNQESIIYISGNNKNKAMPDIYFFKQKYSLTTSIL